MQHVKTENPRMIDALICEHVLGWKWFTRFNSSQPNERSACRWILDPNDSEVRRMVKAGGLFPATGEEILADDWLNRSFNPVPRFHASVDACLEVFNRLVEERQGKPGKLAKGEEPPIPGLYLQTTTQYNGEQWAVIECPVPMEEWVELDTPEQDRWYGFHAESQSIALCIAILSYKGVSVEIGDDPVMEAPLTRLEYLRQLQERDGEVGKLKAALLAVSRFWYKYRKVKGEMYSHPEFMIPSSAVHEFAYRMPCNESLDFQKMIKQRLGLKYLDELDPDCRHYEVKIRVVSVAPGAAQVIIPDWNKDLTLHVALDTLPDMVRMSVQEGYTRLVGRINGGATEPDELDLREVRLDVD